MSEEEIDRLQAELESCSQRIQQLNNIIERANVFLTAVTTARNKNIEIIKKLDSAKGLYDNSIKEFNSAESLYKSMVISKYSDIKDPNYDPVSTMAIIKQKIDDTKAQLEILNSAHYNQAMEKVGRYIEIQSRLLMQEQQIYNDIQSQLG